MILAARSLLADDVPSVVELQTRCYGAELLETAESYLRKLAVYPAGCLGAYRGSEMAGYVFGHPWLLGTNVPLDCRDWALPGQPDCMYIHDLAVNHTCRGSGVATILVSRLTDLARTHALTAFALVAVQQSEL